MGYYSFTGDLMQMSKQRDLLQNHGVNVEMSNVYPTVKTEEEYKCALELIWDRYCDGWWHYKDKYVKYGICSKTEFNLRLGRGKIDLMTAIKDNDIKMGWDEWWKSIGEQKIKINDIPIIGLEEENEVYGEKRKMTQLYLGNETIKSNEVEVELGDKITVDEVEFIIQ